MEYGCGAIVVPPRAEDRRGRLRWDATDGTPMSGTDAAPSALYPDPVLPVNLLISPQTMHKQLVMSSQCHHLI